MSRCLAALGPAAAVVGAVATALCACTVGPNYHRPEDASAPTFVRAPASAPTDPPSARWWIALADPTLERLIDSALKSSPTLEVAVARVREARASLAAERAKELPNTGLSAAYLRTHNLTSALGAAPENGSSDADIYALAFDATWEIDLFGAHRRAVEGAAAALQGSRAGLRDAQVSLSAEVAEGYVELRDAQQRAALTERNIDVDRRLVELVRRRRAAGTASDLDLERLQSQLDTTRATLTPLKTQVLLQMDRLAMLTGQVPGSLDAELEAPLAVPTPPPRIAIGDPAALLRRRPDIAEAEHKLAQQTAAVGEDTAAFFPKLTLLGDVGFAAPSARSLFDGSSFTYVAAPLLQWTPLDFGRTRATLRAARAARDEAEADYHRTVLAALEDAESALARYGQQRISVQQLASVAASARHIQALTAVRLEHGAASTTDVLDADANLIGAELDYAQALAALSTDFIALQKSLGLGWRDARAAR